MAVKEVSANIMLLLLSYKTFDIDFSAFLCYSNFLAWLNFLSLRCFLFILFPDEFFFRLFKSRFIYISLCNCFFSFSWLHVTFHTRSLQVNDVKVTQHLVRGIVSKQLWEYEDRPKEILRAQMIKRRLIISVNVSCLLCLKVSSCHRFPVYSFGFFCFCPLVRFCVRYLP